MTNSLGTSGYTDPVSVEDKLPDHPRSLNATYRAPVFPHQVPLEGGQGRGPPGRFYPVSSEGLSQKAASGTMREEIRSWCARDRADIKVAAVKRRMCVGERQIVEA